MMIKAFSHGTLSEADLIEVFERIDNIRNISTLCPNICDIGMGLEYCEKTTKYIAKMMKKRYVLGIAISGYLQIWMPNQKTPMMIKRTPPLLGNASGTTMKINERAITKTESRVLPLGMD
ncbi:MAG: hypothetical protein ABFS03_03280 [Chloroflexota bacterium]